MNIYRNFSILIGKLIGKHRVITIWRNTAVSDVDQIQGDIFCSGTFAVSKSYSRSPFSCADIYILECHCVRHRLCSPPCIVRNRIEIQTGIHISACSCDDIRPLIRNKSFILFLIAVWINVDLVLSIQAQRHSLLRHRPRDEQAQQAAGSKAAKQQRHPFLHGFFLLLMRRPAARPVHDVRCLIIPYPLPDFQGTDAIFEAQTAFSIANLLLNPKHRGKALPMRPTK